jgi:hypothetical protein
MNAKTLARTGELAESLARIAPGPSALDLPHGIHAGVSEDVYHRKVLGLANKSSLDLVLRAPAAYRAWVDNADEDTTTPAMVFGKDFHCALLEPERYAAQPPPKTAKARADADTIARMVEAVRRHPLAGPVVERGRAELTARWADPQHGLECKARGDIWLAEIGTLVDVKTCSDASPDGFARSVANYHYHRQEAFYRDGWGALDAPVEHFRFIAIEKTPPYLIGFYALDEAAVVVGRRQVRRALGLLAQCIERDEWPGLPDFSQEISLPRWAERG